MRADEARGAPLRSPVSRQAIARAMRPPSSGKAGTRLKSSRITLKPTSTDSRTTGMSSVWSPLRRPASNSRSGPHSAIVDEPADDHDQQRHERARRRRRGTRRPASRCRGSSSSRRRTGRARSADTSIPSRRAAIACPSSCSRIEPKNRTAASHRDGEGDRVRGGEGFLERVLEKVDEQEQDEEPGRVDPDADPEDARQLERAARTEHAAIVAQARPIACWTPDLTLESRRRTDGRTHQGHGHRRGRCRSATRSCSGSRAGRCSGRTPRFTSRCWRSRTP